MNDTDSIRHRPPTFTLGDATTWQAVWPVLLIGAVVFVVVDVYWRQVGAATTRADVGDIVHWSRTLDRPAEWLYFNKYGRMPLQPFLLWLVRGLSFDVLPDSVVCHIVIVSAWVASLFWVAGIVRILWPDGVRLGVLGWGLFPFTGMTYVVFPVADVLALSLTAAAIYAGLRGRWWSFVVATNLALISHKAVWPLLFLIALVFWWQKGMRWWHVVASGVLLTAYWAWGWRTFSPDQPLWLLSVDGDFNYLPEKESTILGIPFLDGIRASVAEGGPKAWVKALIYPSLLIVTAALGVDAVRRRDWLSLAFVFPTIFFVITLNRLEIWAVMRFGHPTVLAACTALAARPAWAGFATRPVTYRAVAAALFVSQLLWGIGRMADKPEPKVKAADARHVASGLGTIELDVGRRRGVQCACARSAQPFSGGHFRIPSSPRHSRE
jgi:hypothetical protein